jgi:zona occludens toxin
MLVFRTGLMGHGKTLNAIKEIDAKAKTEGRPVYYHNVSGLKPERLKAQWYAFDDPHKWFELPDNSIVLIDEAQRFFGVRDPRKAVPDYCSQFETMRHDGLEVHLVTQHASFLDAHIRKLCNKHIYVLRIFGGKKLSRYEAEKCIDVDKQTALKDASHSFVKLDSKFFGVYDSAVEHHFKFRPPGKMLLIPLLLVFIAFMIYRAFNSFNGGEAAQAAKVAAITTVNGATALASGDSSGSAGGNGKHLSAQQYVAIRTPRLPDVPSSAPIYDTLTEPKTYPRLSCVISSDPNYIERNTKRYRVVTAGKKSYICECYTQQGTWHKTTFAYCKNAVEYGAFDAAIADRNKQEIGGQLPARPVNTSTAQPAAPAHNTLTIVPDSEYPARPWH